MAKRSIQKLCSFYVHCYSFMSCAVFKMEATFCNFLVKCVSNLRGITLKGYKPGFYAMFDDGMELNGLAETISMAL